ncbi:MAG TPA: hypothetical protein PLU80_07760 [Acidobacteriota bacterium]|nr:hypothetical protein [Acidobacteriota bacterium]
MKSSYGKKSDQELKQWLKSAINIDTVAQTPTGQYVLVLESPIPSQTRQFFNSPGDVTQVTPILDLQKSKDTYTGYLGFEVVDGPVSFRFGRPLKYWDLDIYDQIVTTGVLAVAASMQGPIIGIDVTAICPSLKRLLAQYREFTLGWIEDLDLKKGFRIDPTCTGEVMNTLRQNQLKILRVEFSNHETVRLTVDCTDKPAVRRALSSSDEFGNSLQNAWYYIIEDNPNDWQVFLEIRSSKTHFHLGFSLEREIPILKQIIQHRAVIVQAQGELECIGLGNLTMNNLQLIIDKYETRRNQVNNPYQPG